MPAPKAVICDIVDRGLDPTQPHRRIGSDGRLASLPVVEKVRPERLQKAVEQRPHHVPTSPVHPEETAGSVEGQVDPEVADEKPTDEHEQASPAAKKGRNKKPAESQA